MISAKEKILWAGALLAAYAVLATWGQFDFHDLMGYYNLQADGLRHGHLYIEPSPYHVYVHDMVPFQGHYYLQWGPFPAILHLAARLAGLSLSDRVACLLAGWLSALVFLETILLLARRYFPALPPWVCRWFFLAFAFGSPTAIVALRGTIYHESIAWAALCVLAAFLAFLRYAGGLAIRWAWLCGAAIGLAALTRVTQALYAAGLLVGIAAACYEGRRTLRGVAAPLAAFAAPVALAVLLLLAYNQVRFGSPWEYGQRYLPISEDEKRPYRLGRVPENFRHYVLAPIRVSKEMPWLEHLGWTPLVQTARAEDMSSMILASPFVLLGCLSWMLVRARGVPLIFTAVAAGSALAVFFSLLCFSGTSRRYLQDFFPVLLVVAFVGVAAHAGAGNDWRRWRKPARAVLLYSAMLHLHLVFFQPMRWGPPDPNMMKTYVALSPLVRRVFPGHNLDAWEAIYRNDLGLMALERRRADEAVRLFEGAVALAPHQPEYRSNLRKARGAR